MNMSKYLLPEELYFVKMIPFGDVQAAKSTHVPN
jgi:hypothetical protein